MYYLFVDCIKSRDLPVKWEQCSSLVLYCQRGMWESGLVLMKSPVGREGAYVPLSAEELRCAL